VAAVHHELNRARGQRRAVHDVVAGQGVDHQLVLGRLGAPDVDLGRQAEGGHLARVAGHHDRVVTGGAFDGDGVGGVVAGGAARRARQVQVDRGHVGAGQVVDGDPVGAAQGDEVDLLGAVDVH